ncbi:hypothetical protein PLEOSDRAFT_165657 [Pleurotus ostreatus PC15]|uniref:Uncharacterized protein n=1 Tax=Pleurotus ostreatus (strain PC15) TaxID=1137138 RepID=A0A067NSJ5_PLEO1|nr:hypothetical protein PLEOSDRAFT_165657 [Pleurotus ostreatus PC15]
MSIVAVVDRAEIRLPPKWEAYSIDKIREDPKGDLWVEWGVLEVVNLRPRRLPSCAAGEYENDSQEHAHHSAIYTSTRPPAPEHGREDDAPKRLDAGILCPEVVVRTSRWITTNRYAGSRDVEGRRWGVRRACANH